MAVVVIFLLLAANFQSLRLAFVVVSTVPAVLAGVVLMLLVTRTTINVQSFMGAIMAIGVAVANAILLVTFAEQARRGGRRAAGDRGGPGTHAAGADDERRDDRGHDADGAGDRRRRGGDGAARPRRHRRAGRGHDRHAVRAAVGVFDRPAVGAAGVGVARS